MGGSDRLPCRPSLNWTGLRQLFLVAIFRWCSHLNIQLFPFVHLFVLQLFVHPEFFYMPFKAVYLNQIKSQGCTRIIKTLVGHIFVPTR